MAGSIVAIDPDLPALRKQACIIRRDRQRRAPRGCSAVHARWPLITCTVYFMRHAGLHVTSTFPPSLCTSCPMQVQHNNATHWNYGFRYASIMHATRCAHTMLHLRMHIRWALPRLARWAPGPTSYFPYNTTHVSPLRTVHALAFAGVMTGKVWMLLATPGHAKLASTSHQSMYSLTRCAWKPTHPLGPRDGNMWLHVTPLHVYL